MDILITADRLDLLDPEEFQSFAVVTDLARDALRQRVAAVDGLSIVDDGDHLRVAPALVLALRAAGGEVPGSWRDRFDAMLAFAEGRGWLGPTGLRAHVEVLGGGDSPVSGHLAPRN